MPFKQAEVHFGSSFKLQPQRAILTRYCVTTRLYCYLTTGLQFFICLNRIACITACYTEIFQIVSAASAADSLANDVLFQSHVTSTCVTYLEPRRDLETSHFHIKMGIGPNIGAHWLHIKLERAFPSSRYYLPRSLVLIFVLGLFTYLIWLPISYGIRGS
jgi:hypothetical protein